LGGIAGIGEWEGDMVVVCGKLFAAWVTSPLNYEANFCDE